MFNDKQEKIIKEFADFAFRNIMTKDDFISQVKEIYEEVYKEKGE